MLFYDVIALHTGVALVAAPRCRAVHFAQQSVQGSAPCVKRSSHGDIVDLCRTLWHRQCVPNLSSCSLPHTPSLPSPQWCRIVFVDLAPQVGVWRAVTLRALSSGTSSVCLSCTPAAFRIRASWVKLTQEAYPLQQEACPLQQEACPLLPKSIAALQRKQEACPLQQET